jgi:hypothetical protein
VVLSFAAAGIVPLDPILILAELPHACPEYAKVRTTATRRVDISGRCLTTPEMVSQMDGPRGLDDVRSALEAEEERDLLSESAEGTGDAWVVYVEEGGLGEARSARPVEMTGSRNEVPEGRQQTLAYLWKSAHREARRIDTGGTEDEAITIEDSDDELQSRGRRMQRSPVARDTKAMYEEEEIVLKKKKSQTRIEDEEDWKPIRWGRRGKDGLRKRLDEDEEEAE